MKTGGLLLLFWIACDVGYLMLLSIAQTEPLSGGAGWVGAGLLGAVLVWLCMVRLPANDAMTKDLIAANDGKMERTMLGNQEQVKALAESWKEVARDARADFKESLTLVIAHCDREVAATSNALRTELSEFSKVIIDLRLEFEENRAVMQEYLKLQDKRDGPRHA